jgi:hypothetical protein
VTHKTETNDVDTKIKEEEEGYDSDRELFVSVHNIE